MLPGVRELSPEYKNLLRTSLVQLIDEFFEDTLRLKELDSDFQETHMWIFLPPEQYENYDYAFAKKFLACLITVSHKLESASFEMLSCIAEQMAMAAIIEQAETLADLLGLEVDLASFEASVLYDAELDLMFKTDAHYASWFKPLNPEDPANPYVTWH